MDDVEILAPGDASEKQPTLHRMREIMLEPSWVDIPFYKMRELTPIPRYATDLSSIIETVRTHEWEKILIVENDVQYYAWRHVETKLVLL